MGGTSLAKQSQLVKGEAVPGKVEGPKAEGEGQTMHAGAGSKEGVERTPKGQGNTAGEEEMSDKRFNRKQVSKTKREGGKIPENVGTE